MNHTWYRSILMVMLMIFMVAPCADAGVAGSVTHVSGPLAARKGDGKVKALSIHSPVESGDLLITEKRTYARIKFNDNSEITLKPNTQFKVEEFGYNKENPKEDKAVYNLVKGGLRAVTGQIGKRTDPDSYKMKTPTATIGVRGTVFTADYVEADQKAEGFPAPVLVALAESTVKTDAQAVLIAQAAGLEPGLYVHVLDGTILLSNQGGAQSFSSGQYGHVRCMMSPPDAACMNQPPVLLPRDPGIYFTPPPGFSSDPGGRGTHAPEAGNSGKSNCEVR